VLEAYLLVFIRLYQTHTVHRTVRDRERERDRQKQANRTNVKTCKLSNTRVAHKHQLTHRFSGSYFAVLELKFLACMSRDGSLGGEADRSPLDVPVAVHLHFVTASHDRMD